MPAALTVRVMVAAIGLASTEVSVRANSRMFRASLPSSLETMLSSGGCLYFCENARGLAAANPRYVILVLEDRAQGIVDNVRCQRDRIKLIGKREIRRMNTSSANAERLVRETTNYVYMSPDDARRIGVANDDVVEVRSGFGRIERAGLKSDTARRWRGRGSAGSNARV